MSPAKRVGLCALILLCGFAAQGAIEKLSETPRPLLKRKLATIPLELGRWVGQDEPVDPAILEEAQATDFLSRVYTHAEHPGRRMSVWINFSEHGLNLRHSPEICLPSSGWEKRESECRVIQVNTSQGAEMPVTRLVYSKGELVQSIGFWYYIFGEGQLEQFVRSLPITSRSSHGRATRGSGLTVELFCPGEGDPDSVLMTEFATTLLAELEPILPDHRANYFIP
jgi:hypothetical protein